MWFAGWSLIKLSLEERRPRDLHPFQPCESEGFFIIRIDHEAGTVEFAHARRQGQVIEKCWRFLIKKGMCFVNEISGIASGLVTHGLMGDLDFCRGVGT